MQTKALLFFHRALTLTLMPIHYNSNRSPIRNWSWIGLELELDWTWIEVTAKHK